MADGNKYSGNPNAEDEVGRCCLCRSSEVATDRASKECAIEDVVRGRRTRCTSSTTKRYVADRRGDVDSKHQHFQMSSVFVAVPSEKVRSVGDALPLSSCK